MMTLLVIIILYVGVGVAIEYFSRKGEAEFSFKLGIDDMKSILTWPLSLFKK